MNRTLIAAAAVLAATVPQAAMANTIIVSATALQSCVVTATSLGFGDVRPGTAVIDTSANINLVCTPNTNFNVLLNDGTNPEGTVRRMKGGLTGTPEYIPYNLYQDSKRETRWGNTKGTDTVAGTASALGTASIPVYGRIALDAKPVSAGAYLDTVTVSVAF